LLQPTSPLRKVEHIDGCIEKCLSSNSDSCVSVTEVDKSPYWMYKIDENDKLIPLFEGNLVTRRQDLPKVYALNGAVYVAATKVVLDKRMFITNNSVQFTISKQHSPDIDNLIDFNYCEFLMRKVNE
ncbi:MAG: acylneuraminate cytidylyltransferase family protein, partial [Bacteroidia bacterium]|nr:acylneuraminate cytidylyltransferase family protein [Bacteroidia bacterium]